MPPYDPRQQLEEGHIFEGKHRIIRELGRGGFGVVYLAHQMKMDRPVALKVLKPGVGEHDPSARERFLREVKIISKLRHPNTVTIHDFGETTGGIVYMVLEFVEGKTLKDLLTRQGAQKPMRSLGLCRQIARSLAEAHRHGIIHRDLKPANIMLTDLEGDDDFVKVLDFGVARLMGSEDVDLTRAGVPDGQRALIGTPRYMSPEQVRGEDLTAASDLYGLGLMLYEMLIGEPAVQGDTTMGLISQQISPEPLRLRSIRSVHPGIQDLILQATDKVLPRRFQSGEEFAAAIDETAQRLSSSQGARGRSNAREFQATSGRFSAINSPSPQPPGRSRDSHPRHASTDTPHHMRRHSTSPSGRGENNAPHIAAAGHRREPQIDVDASEWYEPQFEGSQLAQRSKTDAELFPDPSSSEAGRDPSIPVVSNRVTHDDEESGICGIPSADLPLPPDAAGVSPFADEPKPEPESATTTTGSAQNENPKQEQDESTLGFTLVVLKIGALATLAIFFSYVAFIILGALIGEFTEGRLRLAIAASVALAIPLFTALGENSQKERFDVLVRARDRIARVFIGIAGVSAVTIVLMCFAMPGQINKHLRGDPNWMYEPEPGIDYEETTPRALNRDLSYVIADMIEGVTSNFGWYDGTQTLYDDRDSSDSRPSFVAPPEPTRPGTRGGNDEPSTESDNGDSPSASPPPSRPSTSPSPTPPNTTGGEADTDDDDDYISW